MAECENCGRSAKLRLVEIAGARMFVCPDCAKYGKPIKEKEPPKPSPQQTTRSPVRRKTPRPGKPDAMSPREMDLAEDYPRRIQRGRERKGWSREELGKKINERVSVIGKLEKGEMHPSDTLIKKLERTLSIKLTEPVEQVSLASKPSSSGMTLGDFILEKKG